LACGFAGAAPSGKVFAVVDHQVIAGVAKFGLGPCDRSVCVVPHAVLAQLQLTAGQEIAHRATADAGINLRRPRLT
jgi:hypothetical protein